MKPYDLALSALRYAAGDASSSEYPPHADERASEIRRRAAAALRAVCEHGAAFGTECRRCDTQAALALPASPAPASLAGFEGHSPLPWRCVGRFGVFRVYDADDRPVAVMAQLSPGEAKANGSALSAAVNAYPALVEALRDLVEAAEGLAGQQAMPDDSYKPALDKARAVLGGKS